MKNGINLAGGKAPRRLAVKNNKLVMLDGSSVEEYFESVQHEEGRPICIVYSDTLDEILFERLLNSCA